MERGDSVLRGIVHRCSPFHQEPDETLPPEHRRHMERGHAVRCLLVHGESSPEQRFHRLEITVAHGVQSAFEARVEPRRLPGARRSAQHPEEPKRPEAADPPPPIGARKDRHRYGSAKRSLPAAYRVRRAVGRGAGGGPARNRSAAATRR